MKGRARIDPGAGPSVFARWDLLMMNVAALLATSALIVTFLPGLARASDATSPEAGVSGGRPGDDTSSPEQESSKRGPTIGFISAGDLRDRCRSTSSVSVSYCFAYVTGVYDTVQAYEEWLGFTEFCLPLRSAQADLTRAFVDYLDRHPAAQTGEAASVVVIALKHEFACERLQTPGSAPIPRG